MILQDLDITDNIRNMFSKLIIFMSVGVMNSLPLFDFGVLSEDVAPYIKPVIVVFGWFISGWLAVSTIMKRMAERKKIKAEARAIYLSNKEKEMSTNLISKVDELQAKLSLISSDPELKEKLESELTEAIETWSNNLNKGNE